ncbi:hypothetical protein EVAR_101105_1 [Eumeta japonica]|uniref:Uncharacterized protein n=1 Tax=Eumeta variegata TaxID=151549 RepID=A0A4C1TFJ2_EUMVA|nr:hypothetical protein EVAR_101105_1 [Eumeta japonica]
MSSKTYADIAVAEEKITNEVSRAKFYKKIEQKIKNKQKGVGGENKQQPWMFQVVARGSTIKGDGILGRDNIWGKSKLDSTRNLKDI